MAAEASGRITVEEYFAILEASPTKLDFIDGRIIDPWAMEEGSPEAMAGGRLRHSLVASNMNRALGPAADARGCIVLTSDTQVQVDEQGNYCFPDLTVACGDFDDEALMLDDPVVVVEVLSPSTQSHDRGAKFDRYLRLPSVEEIVFVFQEKPCVERYQRRGRVWVYEWVEGLDAQIEILGAPLRLADVYRRVKFSPKDPAPPQREGS